jgi:hypothetical protein
MLVADGNAWMIIQDNFAQWRVPVYFRKVSITTDTKWWQMALDQVS